MKPLVKGDWDGLFALGLDNLLMLLLMSSLCLGVLGFSPDLFFGRVLPATAIGLVIGNLFYARMALRLARAENRNDVCAMPYGINLLTVFVYVLQVMLPAQGMALADGLDKEAADRLAWHAGLAACLGSGLIEFLGAFIVTRLQRITPRAALLAALAGIGIFFIAMDFVFRSFTYPLVGFTTLAITLLVYFGRVRIRGGVPAGLLILGLGTALAWLFYRGEGGLVPVGQWSTAQFGLHLPLPVFGELAQALPYMVQFLPIIIPMGLINLVLSLQNIESAAAAGDRYEARPVLLFNGLGTLAAAGFGSPFPTTIYIGHPGWKSLGARAGYSTLNAVVMSLICFTGSLSLIGYLVPVEAGMAILIWIGLMMGAQAFQATPAAHAPAVVIGLLPALGAFAAMVVKNGFRAAGYGSEEAFDPGLIDALQAQMGFFADGVFALEQGYVYTSMILAAATVAIIERHFRTAALWFLVGAVLAAIGFVHSYTVGFADVTGSLVPGWKWVVGYLVMAAIFVAAPLFTEQTEEDGAAPPV
ncbi:MAG: NCS2 family permease [Opitutales bacterium]